MSSGDVPLTEGVKTTLNVFGLLHDAFLSATPPSSGSSVPPSMVNAKARTLEEFQSMYKKALENAKLNYIDNQLSKELGNFHKSDGEKLLIFANMWQKYTMENKSKEEPSEQDKTDALVALDKMKSKVNSQEYDSLRAKIDEFKHKYDKKFPTLFLASAAHARSLQRVSDKLVKAPSRNDGYLRAPDSSKYTFPLDFTKETALVFLDEAITNINDTPPSVVNPKGTWHDFAERAKDLEVGAVSYKSEGFDDLAKNATNLLGIDKLYGSVLGVIADAFVASLESARILAEKFAAGFQNGGSQGNADKAKPFIAFAKSLDTFVANFKTHSQSVSVVKIPRSFDATFPTELSTIKNSMNQMSNDYGQGQSTGWKRPSRPSASSTAYGSSSSYTPGSGYVATSGTGVGAGAGSSSSGSSSGPLFREIDGSRVRECTDLVVNFLRSLGEAESRAAERIVRNAGDALSQVQGKQEKLNEGAQSDNLINANDGLRDQRVRIIRTCLSRVRGILVRHRDRHVMFALRHNRSALRYMMYWRDLKISKSSMTNEYFSKLEAAVEKGKSEVDLIVKDFFDITKQAKTFQGLSDTEVESLADNIEALGIFQSECKERIVTVHKQPSTFLDQFVSDSHVHLIYVLKAIRFALVWMSMTIALRAFTSMYASNVYIKNMDPPSPLIFLAIFFGTDLSLNAALLTILWAASRIFKSPTNEFPIDSYLLTAWSVDIACSEIAMVGIGYAFANIISTKKAFRYRQEGDRGIRALGQMMMNSYAVLLLVPFFRIV